MSDIDPLEAQLPPARPLPSGDLKKIWRDNPTGIKELTYGDRDPAQRGYQKEHNHANFGGLHLGLALERYSFGPYTRLRGDMDPGFPICPPEQTLYPISFATGRAKLLAVVPCRLIGGVIGVNVDMLFLGELSSSPQNLTLGVVLRPLGAVNTNDFLGSIAEGVFSYGHLKKLSHSFSAGLSKQRVTLSDLTRLGSGVQTRMAELCFFLCSDLSVNNMIHFLSALVTVAAVTTEVELPYSNDPPNQEISPALILAGQPLSSGLGAQAKAQGNALARSILGGQPGYLYGQVHPAKPFVEELDGAHQHQGKELRQADGTIKSDGALLPYSLFSQGYPQVNEDGDDEFDDADPCTGLLVSRSGVIGEECTFFQEIPLAAGAKSLRFCFALLPETTKLVSRLELVVHLCRSNVAPSSSNNLITAVDGFAAVDAAGFVVGTVLATQTPGYQDNGPRLQQGLGLWTTSAKIANAETPPGVVLANAYRISQEITLRLSSAARQTENYCLRYRFLLYEGTTEATLDDEAGLIWVHAYAAE